MTDKHLDLEKHVNLINWVLKQAPVIALLIGTNIAQYRYFTNQIEKLETRIERLQDKLIK